MLTSAGIAPGLLLLIAGGASLVRGASEIALRFGVSPMIVGLTTAGVGDLVFSWPLGALLIPIVFIGKARFGRLVGVAYLLSYLGYAVWRVSGA